jgi:hypothetical protein
VVHNKYSKKYCKKCNKEYIKPVHNWCAICQINDLKNDFANWTSGNKKIDDLIQEKQLKFNENAVFEWIPYNKFINIKEIEDNCLITTCFTINVCFFDSILQSFYYIIIMDFDIVMKISCITIWLLTQYLTWLTHNINVVFHYKRIFVIHYIIFDFFILN